MMRTGLKGASHGATDGPTETPRARDTGAITAQHPPCLPCSLPSLETVSDATALHGNGL